MEVPSQDSTCHEAQWRNKFQFGQEIGSGASGKIVAATDIASQATCAVKIVKCARDGSVRTQIEQEVEIWRKVGHQENCVRLIEVFVEPDSIYMVMEQCASTILQKLRNVSKCAEKAFLKVTQQMMHGLAHIHALDIIHRDIKPDNILWGSDSRVKIIDFGIAVTITKGELLAEEAGTAPYMSPEMARGEGYDQAADIWSLGATLYELLYGAHPYIPAGVQCTASIKEAIKADNPKPSYRGLDGVASKAASADVIQFVQSLMDRSPAVRPTADTALRSSVFSGRRLSTSSADTLATMGSTEEMGNTEDSFVPHETPGKHKKPSGSNKVSATARRGIKRMLHMIICKGAQ